MDGASSGEGEIQDPRLTGLLDEGRALREAGRLDEAVAILREAKEGFPEEPDVYEALGSALGDAGRRGEAIAAWSEALRLRPESERPRLILSFWLKKEEQFDAALAVLREGLDRCPSRRGLWLKEIVRLCVDLEQPTRAIQFFNELLEAQPDDTQVYRFRADLLRKIRVSRSRH